MDSEDVTSTTQWRNPLGRISGHPLNDLHNPGALLIFRDLSQQLQQHEEHQHLASMPEESPNPIVEVDPQGRLTYANPAMIRLLDTFGFRADGIPHVLPATLTQITKECLKTMEPMRGLTVVVEQCHFDWTFRPFKTEDWSEPMDWILPIMSKCEIP